MNDSLTSSITSSVFRENKIRKVLEEMSRKSVSSLVKSSEELIKENEAIYEEIFIMDSYLSHAPGSTNIKFESIHMESHLKLTKNKFAEVVSQELDILRKKKTELENKHSSKMRETNVKMNECKIFRKKFLKDEEEFKNNVVYQSISSRTRKVIAEKVEMYFMNFLKQQDNEILKLKQKNKKLNILFKKLNKRLKRKTVMDEKLRRIDYDQLRIENGQMREKEKQLNDDIVSLKFQTGKSQVLLTSRLEELSSLQHSRQELLNEIKSKEEKLNSIEEKIQREEKLKDYHEKKNISLKKLHNELNVPDVLDYVKVKSDLNLFRKEVRDWERKVTIAKRNKELYRRKSNQLEFSYKNFPSKELRDPVSEPIMQ